MNLYFINIKINYKIKIFRLNFFSNVCSHKTWKIRKYKRLYLSKKRTDHTMASALTKVIKCILSSSTGQQLDSCMNDFGSNVFYTLAENEQKKIQDIFIDTAKSIDLVAYRKTTLLIILIAVLLVTFIVVLIFYCICICTNCCNCRTRKKRVYAPPINNTYLLQPNMN